MQTERYIMVLERLNAARRCGRDVDHYIEELHWLWSTMDQHERLQLTKLLAEKGEKRAAA